MSTTERRIAGLELIAASFVVLALELTLIRWMAAQVRITAYFPNLVLISAFLGLGIGCLLPRPKRSALPMWSWPLVVAVGAAIVAAMSGIIFTHRSTTEFLWYLYYDLGESAPVVQGIRLPIITVFILGSAMFVPLGSFIAERLQLFRDAGRPLIGYACDLGGSLLGVVVMAALFFTGARPVIWFALVFVAGAALFIRARRGLLIHVVAAGATLLLVHFTDRADVYSPYYGLRAVQREGHVEILTNGSLHQDALPLRRSGRIDDPIVSRVREGYHLPYRVLGRPPRNVLILGAGTGNDISVALDQGARSIDAVEIDPEILKLGKLHPDRPYESDRVRVWNTDARAFLNYHREKYDLIVFGTLDSMTRLSALSNVRLDNFVYTVESLRAARERLTDDGGIILYFAVATPYIEEHITAMLVRAFGERPNVIIRDGQLLFNRIFLIGPAFAHLNRDNPLTAGEREAMRYVEAPSDDWPFLYLNGRHISPFYLSMMGVILVITAAAVFLVSAEMRRSIISRGIDVEMFLFGLAFLLMETKLVTEMNLVWGATWITSAVVFGSILLMVLIGTLAMARWRFSWAVGAWGLVLSLLVVWLAPVGEIVGRPFGTRLLASVLYCGVPIAFSSICFALLFRERARPDVAFGWNMIGAVAGGLLEFLSMVVGIKAMTLLALAAYLFAIMWRQRSRRTAAAPVPVPAQ